MANELAGKKILLVDDDPDILGSMEMALEDMGAEILLAENGNDGVASALEDRPDLIVLDQMLPGRSGFLVMERIRRGKKKSDGPRVIMITANQGARHRIYAESLGVDLYLNKPFRMEKLIDAVKEVLSHTEQ